MQRSNLARGKDARLLVETIVEPNRIEPEEVGTRTHCPSKLRSEEVYPRSSKSRERWSDPRTARCA